MKKHWIRAVVDFLRNFLIACLQSLWTSFLCWVILPHLTESRESQTVMMNAINFIR